MSPLLARAALGSDARLVARPQSPVVHLARATGRQVTPGGKLRRGTRPLCGQRGRAWPLLDVVTGRRLCRRCERAARPAVAAAGPAVAHALTEQELLALLDAATDARQLHEAKMLVLASAPGMLHRLAPAVRVAQGRLGMIRPATGRRRVA